MTTFKKTRWERLKTWAEDHPVETFIGAYAAVMVTIGGIIYYTTKDMDLEEYEEETPKEIKLGVFESQWDELIGKDLLFEKEGEPTIVIRRFPGQAPF